MRKAQEEMVGFAMLVVIVAVIGIIFLAITLRTGQSSDFNSLSVQQFAEAMVQTTSSCSEDNFNFLTIGEAFDACYNNPSLQCNSQQVCEYLNQNIPTVINQVWNIKPDAAYNAFQAEGIFKDSISKEENPFILINSGNCSSNSLSGEALLPDSRLKGNILFRVKICQNSA